MPNLLIIFTVITTLQHGIFHSTCPVEVTADYTTTCAVVDSFCYDLQTDINRLFDWAFVGAGSANNEEQDAVIVEYLETHYDPILKEGQVLVNVHVKGLRTFKHIRVGSYITDSLTTDTLSSLPSPPTDSLSSLPTRHTIVTITYSGSLLKLANATFHVEPISPTQTRLTLDTNCKFGFFFSLFVTRRVYHNILDWRIDRFMQNLKEMAETGSVQQE